MTAAQAKSLISGQIFFIHPVFALANSHPDNKELIHNLIYQRCLVTLQRVSKKWNGIPPLILLKL
jgi:hypothetical protein